MLESLLCVKSVEYCSDCFFINEMFQRFSGIAAKRKHLPKPFDHDELEGIADALKDLLHHSPIMPLTLVAKVHSTIGIIHQMMGENDYALNAFTKALYLHTKAANPDILEVGLLMSRIGVLRKRKGDHDVAFNMLLRALQIYKRQGVNENHTYYLATKIELQGIRSCLRISHSNDT
jgi:tetratricopeptide (TPR) repeat protein